MDGIINFYSENKFQLENQETYAEWINQVVLSEGRAVGELSYIFCDDEYLLELNQKFLNHDTLTDILSFDDSVGNILSGDIFISTERVQENAELFSVPFALELRRVMAHGVLHFCGYQDGSEEEAQEMRGKEEEKMKMFHVEQ